MKPLELWRLKRKLQ